MEEGREAPSHVVLIPSPGMGHLIPLTEFAKRLLPWKHLSTTVITFSAFTSVAEQSLLTSLSASISIIAVPNIRHDDLGARGGTETKLGDAIMASFPFLRTILLNLKEQAPVVALVTDIITIGVHHVARELGLPAFVFFTTTIMYLTLFLDLPNIYNQTNEDGNLIHLPGNVPFRPKDLPR
ncbi:hypothetical protein HPP92_027448 [Vanilla planifolia]|uniref:Uncharacterized protein n=1 Tax=Vanilla planifolia TaxID=51239 RepID=A0A835PCS5_VANPL|nr:hypothetical protein HPP92_027448 [Vanilla planifolia]KAG0493091.1 hypothetical protein HPP92_006489 [Vanilla planifolia]